MSNRKSKSQILEKRKKKEKRSVFSRLLRWFMGAMVLMLIAGAGTLGGIYYYLCRDLPKISTLRDYRPPVVTSVFSDDGRKIGEFYKERRVVIPLSRMPGTLIQAFVAAEDSRFYRHRGIDAVSIVRAFFKNLEAGTIVQGGSTITQQVTKSFFLTPERSYKRKIKEAILAYRLDKSFKKDEILFLYLNQIYLGHGAYGVQAAAENYFGKQVGELNLAECAILAGLPQAPSRYSPFKHPDRAKQRQIYVLNRMVEEKFITNLQATEGINTKLDIKPRRNWYIEKVPCYTEHVRRYVERKYGEKALYEDGLKVYTSVNIEMQKDAREEVTKGLLDFDKRQGYRGPLDNLEDAGGIDAFLQKQDTPLAEGNVVKGVVYEVSDKAKNVFVRLKGATGTIPLKAMKWAREPNIKVAYYQSSLRKPSRALSEGDVIMVKLGTYDKKEDNWHLSLEQTPDAQSALLSIEAETGHVKVMIGGRDFRNSQFNRAIQSRRQPGSAFKPIIYAAAIDKGYTPATVIIDSPVVFKDHQRDFTWKPKNYKKTFYGPTLFRTALAKSLNVVTVKILEDIGVGYAIEYARGLGIESELSRNLSIALGSSGVSLLEIVKAYSVFANLGYMVEPVFITRIEDRNGNLLEEASVPKEKVIDRATAYIMTSLMESVVKEGTGRRIKALKRPAAGKTGTTNNLYDAWFVGYTPRYVTGVWVGFDEEASMGRGETGSRAASPIWLGFMKRVLENKPVRVFQVPEEVVFKQIDAETGLLPIPESEKLIYECFKEGTVPTEFSPRPDAVAETDDFFKEGI